uniref:substrate-binding domain-containing protein n=1 Tax=Saccharicrinis sp. GN24d3 TaxID=3458416 RepID=UPI004035ABE1
MKLRSMNFKVKDVLLSATLVVLMSFSTGCVEKITQVQGSAKNDSLNDVIIESNVDLSGFKIGYCTPALNAPYYQALLSSIQQTTKAAGMTFVYADGQGDINKQIAAAEDLITKGVDALLLNPLDPNALVGVTLVAEQAGIPVFIIDSSIDPSAKYVTTVQSDNHRNGELAGEWLVKKMGSKKMKIALLSGNAGNPVGKTRKQGLLTGITEEQLRTHGYIDLNIKTQAYTNWSYEGGLKAMEDILVAHPDINVVITESDVCVLGAIKAIRKAGKEDDILIVAAADGQKEAVKLIMETDLYGCTAVNSPVLIGKTAVQYAVQYFNDKRDFEKTSFTPAVLITKENAKEFYNPNAIF